MSFKRKGYIGIILAAYLFLASCSTAKNTPLNFEEQSVIQDRCRITVSTFTYYPIDQTLSFSVKRESTQNTAILDEDIENILLVEIQPDTLSPIISSEIVTEEEFTNTTLVTVKSENTPTSITLHFFTPEESILQW